MAEMIKTVTKSNKLGIYAVFTKMRLASLVIVSALASYLFAGGGFNLHVLYLLLGGLLTTAASNGANQIWERDLDKLMKRTQNRPIPAGNLSLGEAYWIVIVALFSGIVCLYLINLYCALLGLLAFVSYVFLYTPLKRVTPWAVLVGAFPGALPTMIGAVAATHSFGLMPGVLFFIQFMWQFPHFWAIAWVIHEDYQSAGFSLLPASNGKSKESAYQIALYSLALAPFSLLPWLLGWTGTVSFVIVCICSVWFFVLAYRLYISLETSDARKLMFASFVYLPIIQFIYVFDKMESVIPK
jgi:protoheme IX farnesyltransferase